MSTRLSDVNELLFQQMQKLTDDNLKGEQLQAEIEKASAMNNIAQSIVKNSNVQYQALNLGFKAGVIGKQQIEFLLAPPKES